MAKKPTAGEREREMRRALAMYLGELRELDEKRAAVEGLIEAYEVLLRHSLVGPPTRVIAEMIETSGMSEWPAEELADYDELVKGD